MDGLIDEGVDESMDGLIDEGADESMDVMIDEKVDESMDWWMNGCTVDRRTDVQIDRQMDG
eukprot:73284-Chlamydomonas_euryale.AAC.2